jgi:hypothetical protein
MPSLATTHARSCEKCIEEDTDQQGFTSWRVLHSLPSIGHCPQHGVPLRDEGKARSSSAGWPRRLPGEQRSKITDVKAMGLPISNGYAAYLQLWTEAFEGNLTGIVPHLWMLVMDAVIQLFGTVDHACEQISSAIEESWEVSLAHIARSLEIADGGNFVRAELEQRVQASYVASRLVICGALDALNLSPPRRHSSPRLLPIELSPMRSFGAWLTPQTQAELSTLVIDGNFPPALFRAMAEDLDIFKLDARLHIDRYVIRKFAASLPDDLLYRMSMEQSWDRSSWLMREIRRREDSWSRDRRSRSREERERPATSTLLGRGSAAARKQ